MKETREIIIQEIESDDSYKESSLQQSYKSGNIDNFLRRRRFPLV